MDFKKNKADIRHYCQPLRQQQTMKEEEEEQDVGKDTTQLKPEKRRHVFRFRIQFKKYEVTCDASMTVLEALLSNKNFKGVYKKNKEKEMVIQREKVPRGAISTDFPCCLINDDELLNIQFIKSSGSSSSESKPVPCSLMNSTENYIVFNIKTTGGHTVKRLMKNQALKQKVDDVCVYALKGETVKKALQRDGRFNRVIFRKHCGLYELGSEIITDMSNTVDHLDGKHFRVNVIDNQPASQESSQEFDTMKNESGENIPSTSTPGNLSQDSANPQQQNHQPTEKEKDKKAYPKSIQVNKIPNTEEILKLLRDQFEGLQNQLKERESLTRPAEVQKFFREEFDKSAQSFSEVKRVRQLMKLSDCVCQIRVEGSGKGTGFLLFDRFILTNAHVIGGFDPFTQRLHRPITAVFDFEDLDMGNKLSLKENLVAYFYGKNEEQHLDFALLELSDDAKLPDCPELLSRYSPPPTRGGICIVGHPDGGVKRMDPCFIIENDEVPNAADGHQAKNSDFLHVITQQCLAEKWENHYSQISYDSCFFHGSSGSPVFNDHCELIGVHTGGYVYKGKGGKTRSVMEYAFPMLPILVCIVRQCNQNSRSDIVQYFENKNNMKYVLQVANEQRM